MHIGELDQPITLQQRVVAQDATYGSEVVTWSTFATPWAKVTERLADAGSDEAVTEKLRVDHSRLTVRIRWRTGVDSTMRVLLADGRALQITSIALKGRKEWIDLACEQHRES